MRINTIYTICSPDPPDLILLTVFKWHSLYGNWRTGDTHEGVDKLSPQANSAHSALVKTV